MRKRPVYSADRWHFHHRFANIGFSQRRTVLYLYGWTLSLAALALAMRFVPYSDDNGTLNPGWAVVIGLFAMVAFAASAYLVIVLEILKFMPTDEVLEPYDPYPKGVPCVSECWTTMSSIGMPSSCDTTCA